MIFYCSFFNWDTLIEFIADSSSSIFLNNFFYLSSLLIYSYLRTSIEANTDRLIRQSQWAENYTDGEYPMECRHIFGNANIPIGYHGGNSPKHLVKSVPCKNVKQGKETLEEIVQAIESDIDTQRVVASFLNGRKGFDSSTIVIPKLLIRDQFDRLNQPLTAIKLLL